jgi:hypothetical protein
VTRRLGALTLAALLSVAAVAAEADTRFDFLFRADSDDDVGALVEVQLGARVTGLAVFDQAQERSHGRSVRIVVAEENGRPSTAAKGRSGAGPPASGKAKEKAPKGKGKGKGD